MDSSSRSEGASSNVIVLHCSSMVKWLLEEKMNGYIDNFGDDIINEATAKVTDLPALWSSLYICAHVCING
jgi:hypothetical protein